VLNEGVLIPFKVLSGVSRTEKRQAVLECVLRLDSAL
jgi:hypothetical protein